MDSLQSALLAPTNERNSCSGLYSSQPSSSALTNHSPASDPLHQSQLT